MGSGNVRKDDRADSLIRGRWVVLYLIIVYDYNLMTTIGLNSVTCGTGEAGKQVIADFERYYANSLYCVLWRTRAFWCILTSTMDTFPSRIVWITSRVSIVYQQPSYVKTNDIWIIEILKVLTYLKTNMAILLYY